MEIDERVVAELEALRAIYPESFEGTEEDEHLDRFTVQLLSENGVPFSLAFSLQPNYPVAKPSIQFSCPNVSKTQERGFQERISDFITKQCEDSEMLFGICQFAQEMELPDL